MKTQQLPICVDLDGTLVKSDTLVEALIILLKRNPFLIGPMVWWLRGGKLAFKRRVAEQVSLAVAQLPYNESLLAYLRQQAMAGHSLYLLTAASPRIAQGVAGHLGIFSDVIVGETANLAGKAKAAAAIERFGERGFIYAGNGRVDIEVWERAKGAIVVNASKAVETAAARVAPVILTIPKVPLTGRMIYRVLRCHQWVKNVLVFIPVIAGHLFLPSTFLALIGAFVALCITSSSVYVLNDLLDVTADRAHETKRRRPFASGDVSLTTGLVLFPVLLFLGITLGYFVSPGFLGWLVGYLGLTMAYSFYVKRLVIVDVLVLGLLYTIRIFAGAAAVGITVSAWLLVFSLFLFMSLAFLKRFTELIRLPQGDKHVVGRGYRVSDTAPIGGLGMASGYVSVLVLALYISSEEVTVLYERSGLLWLLVPFLLYWISRLWVLAYRDEVHEDPVVFAIQDAPSYILLGMSLLVVFSAT